MSHSVRRSLVPTTLVFVLSCIVQGCSGASSETAGTVGTSGEADSSAIHLDMTPGGFDVTVENRGAQPLLELEVAIIPARRSAPYTAGVARLESSSKRVFSIAEFTEHGARINVNVVKPKEVVATATDFSGKKYEARLPWKE